jgi:hypothetical protein
VGYVNRTFNVGDNLFENPLQNTDNHLSVLFPTAPDGATVSLWDPVAFAYRPTAIFDAFTGKWEDPLTSAPTDFLLNPGTGADFNGSNPFTNTFVGTVLSHDGTGYTDSNPLPPAFTGPAGRYLLGDKCPISATGNDIFLHILGRNPNPGEQYITLTDTYTYQANGTWLKDGIPIVAPTYNVGDAAFFNVLAVPEPSATTFALVGLALWGRRIKRKL